MRPPKRKSSSQPKRPWFAARGAGSRPRRAFVGIDIGATAVKLVELSHSASANTLQARAWGIEPLPPSAVDAANANANISDPSAVGEAIRRLRARVGAKARGAALAVPHSAAVTKTLRMDAGLTDEELEVEVTLEAERHLPFAPDETALDFELSHLCLDDPALVEVEVVACHVDQVRQREAAAAAGGMKAAFVEVETAALARAAHSLEAARSDALEGVPPSPLLLAVLSERATTLLAIAGEEVVFARQEPFGIELPSVSTVAAAAAPAEELVREVAQLARLALAAPGVAGAARLLLAGERADTPGLAPLAAERLGLQVELADPTAVPDYAVAPRKPPLDDGGPTLLTAWGLARRGWPAFAAADSTHPAMPPLAANA